MKCKGLANLPRKWNLYEMGEVTLSDCCTRSNPFADGDVDENESVVN